jgi:predicted transcriptional regulator
MSDSTNMAGDFVRDLGEAARQNPVSAALIGMGVLWLFTGGARRAGFDGTLASNAIAAGGSAMRSGLQSVRDGTSDLADNVGQTVQRAGATSGEAINSGANAIREAGAAAYERTSRLGSDLADSASDFARSIPGSATNMLDTTRSSLATLFRQQPLLLGAVGVAIGAGIAASFPATEMEAEYFGETSDQLKDRVQEFATDQGRRAKTMAEDAVNAAAEEARRQGLDLDGLKSTAADVGARVKTVAGAASDSIKQRASQS